MSVQAQYQEPQDQLTGTSFFLIILSAFYFLNQ